MKLTTQAFIHRTWNKMALPLIIKVSSHLLHDYSANCEECLQNQPQKFRRPCRFTLHAISTPLGLDFLKMCCFIPLASHPLDAKIVHQSTLALTFYIHPTPVGSYLHQSPLLLPTVSYLMAPSTNPCSPFSSGPPPFSIKRTLAWSLCLCSRPHSHIPCYDRSPV